MSQLSMNDVASWCEEQAYESTMMWMTFRKISLNIVIIALVIIKNVERKNVEKNKLLKCPRPIVSFTKFWAMGNCKIEKNDDKSSH